MSPILTTFAILLAAVVAFVTNRIPIVVVALAIPLLLWATGILTIGEALSGFSDPLVIFIATLFVVSEALVATGVTAWVGNQIVGRAGRGRGRLTLVIGGMAAALAGVISINGAVAALLPIVVVVAGRAGIVSSRMLIPLAFAASAGSLLTLTGTPVNIIVSEAAAAAGGREFGYVEFALVGIPLVALTLAVTALGGGRLLPVREPQRVEEAPTDLAESARSWSETYRVDLDTEQIFRHDDGVIEVLIAPRSTLIGRSVCVGMRTRDEDLVVLALKRGTGGEGLGSAGFAAAGGFGAGAGANVGAIGGGGEASREVALTLDVGDSVLVQGPWDALDRYSSSPDVIAVTSPRALRRAIPLGVGARRAVTVLAAMVVLLATGIVPPVVAGIAAATALVLFRVLGTQQAVRAVSWETVVLIASLIPLSAAVVSTGAADRVADGILAVVGTASPHVALLVLCVVTVVLGQFISNVATVLVVAPVSVAVAASLDVSVLPFMMALTVAGAAAFLTPIATPVNLMVMQPGGYRFGDYWRMGLPLTLVFVAVAVLYVPLVWPFG